MVIYVDVLFIINFFINFLLLALSAKLTKMNTKLYRLIISACMGGVYSLIILAPNLPFLLVAISKLFVAIIMLLIAFSFKRIGVFLKSSLVFIFVNLIFLGTVIGVCILFKPNAVAVKNSVVYFDVSAKLLIGCALFSYLLSSLVIRLYNRKLSKKEIYTITIFANDKVKTLYAFLDTGNHLREPFSNYPVIIAEKAKLEGFITDTNTRLIPTTTVNSNKLLVAFKPDKIIIKSPSFREEVATNVYVALSDNINDESYSAILNADILHI